MKKLNLQHLSDEELVRSFAEAAKLIGAAVLDSETRQFNRFYHYLRSIDILLRSRGMSARLKLVQLLDDKDRFVRYYAATKLLGVVPDRARIVIEWNANHWFDALAGDARGLLRAYDTGEYRPD